MKKRILMIASIAVLVVAATVLALAQGHAGQGEKMRRGGPSDMIDHISRELNLTDAQREQMKAVMEAQRPADEERHAKLEEIRKQIDAVSANGQFDEATVRPLANQQAQLMADQMVDHLRMHSKMYSLLTAEQKTKADQLMKTMHGGPGHGPGHGHHGPPPPPPGDQQ
jgi:protein CpxP